MTKWLSSWIIQDGNYGHFAVGDVASFALEFTTDRGTLKPSNARPGATPWLQCRGDAEHEAFGCVAYAADDWKVLDTGSAMYTLPTLERAPQTGVWLRGRVTLGIDQFAYFGRFAKLSDAPALIYDWRITAFGAGSARNHL